MTHLLGDAGRDVAHRHDQHGHSQHNGHHHWRDDDHGHQDGHGSPDEHAHGHAHAHGHDHAHDHGHGPWGRLKHAIGDVFGTHSHEVADQIDDALEADADGRRALLRSLAILGVTAILQGVVVAMSGSVALLGDTLHNVADALTAVPLLIAFSLAKRPATDRLTYGYGRAEDIAGLFVIAMIALSSLLAAYEAVRRLIEPEPVTHLWAVAAAAFIGFAGNEIVARYRITVGRRIGSAALVADGLHARTDGFTSLAVLLGAGGVALGVPIADPIVGLLITLAILGVLRSAVAQVGSRLMDAVDPAVVARARETVARVDGVVGVEELRVRWVGHRLRAEASLFVPALLSLADADDIAHHAEAHLVQDVRHLTDALVHVHPAPDPTDLQTSH